MEVLLPDFKEAQLIGSGPLLATTLTPVSPSTDPDRLNRFYRASNSSSILSNVRYAILHNHSITDQLTKTEASAWVDVYVAYWKAIAELLAAQSSPLKEDWSKVYEAWKEVANALIKGYSGAGFPSWTVPCLYITGKYLRIFAIKADDQARAKGTATYDDGFQDDLVGEYGRNEKLEDAARVINRIFTLCISDRYVGQCHMG